MYEHGGLAGNLLAASLDHPAALRGAAALAILSTVWTLHIAHRILRVLFCLFFVILFLCIGACSPRWRSPQVLPNLGVAVVQGNEAGDGAQDICTNLFYDCIQYPSWAEVAHLPLPLRLLALRYLAGQLGGALLATEAAVRDALADLETSIVEPRLPTIN